MTYASPDAITTDVALDYIYRAISILETYIQAIPENDQYPWMRAGLVTIYNKIQQGEIPPITKEHEVHLVMVSNFFGKAGDIIVDNCNDDVAAMQIVEEYFMIYHILYQICDNLVSNNNDDDNEEEGVEKRKEVARKKEEGTGTIKWHPDVKEEIEDLKNELDRLCPNFKMHAYQEGHDYWQELDDLIGLDSVKHTLREHIHTYEVYLERKKRHPQLQSDFMFNCIFKGRPGTGKTTVARIVAGILKSEGVIKSGHYIETDMSSLGTTWIGMTPKFAKLAALQAIGGVLFFDEAYTLMKKSRNDRNGEEIVDTLTPILSKYGGEMVVILAGYEDEMDKMLKSVNPGFASRFQKSIIFEDYTSTEMYEIFKMAAEKEYFIIDQEAETRLLAILKIIENKKDNNRSYANARTANSLFKLVRAKASARFIADRNTDPDLIIADDIALTKEELRSIGAI